MAKDQRFELRCDGAWRAALRRVAKRMQVSETDAVRDAVLILDECEATASKDFVGYNLNPEQKEPA